MKHSNINQGLLPANAHDLTTTSARTFTMPRICPACTLIALTSIIAGLLSALVYVEVSAGLYLASLP